VLIRCKARRLVGRAGLGLQDLDDLQQEIAVHLLERLELFDPARGSYAAFVRMVVGQAAIGILRFRLAQRRHARVVSLNAEVEGAEGPTQRAHLVGTREQHARLGIDPPSDQEQANLAADVRRVLEALPAEERELAERLLRRTVTEVCREMGVARSTLADRVRSLRQPFERAGLRTFR